MYLKDKISPIYGHLLNKSILDMDIPKEEFANCMDCHHCVHKNSIRAQTKCCDYHPTLPNYIIGGILSDMTEIGREGKIRLAAKIKGQFGVTPYGIMPPFEHEKLYRHTRNGNNRPTKMEVEALLCPYNNNGLCTVWEYRSENCAAFHCHSTGGVEGIKFWDLVKQYLEQIEHLLSIHILKELGYPSSKLKLQRLSPQSLNLEDENGNLDEIVYTNIWDRWRGQESEFFQSCFEHFQKITPEEFSAIVGKEGLSLEKDLHLQSERFKSDNAPDYMIFNENGYQIEHLMNNRISLGSLEMHFIQYNFLKYFDGRTLTYDIVRESTVLKKSISNLLAPLIKIGVLEEMDLRH